MPDSLVVSPLLLALGLAIFTPRDELATGSWRAWLDCPGGELPFGLELIENASGELEAFLLNGPECIVVPTVEVDGSAFPTTIFLHGDGRVHSVHSGFAGPATGEAHAELRREFEATIEELLAEPVPDGEETWRVLAANPWYSRVEFAGARYVFRLDGAGERLADYTVFGSGVPVIREETFAVRVVGNAIWIGDQLWRLDRLAGVFLHQTRFEARLTHDEFQGSRFLAGRGYEGEAGFLRALADPEAIVRREAVIALTYERSPAADAKLPEVHALIGDPDLGVMRAAIWALAECQDHGALTAMLELRSHPNAVVRRGLAAALVRMAKADPRLAAHLAPLTTDPDPLVRELSLGGS